MRCEEVGDKYCIVGWGRGLKRKFLPIFLDFFCIIRMWVKYQKSLQCKFVYAFSNKRGKFFFEAFSEESFIDWVRRIEIGSRWDCLEFIYKQKVEKENHLFLDRIFSGFLQFTFLYDQSNSNFIATKDLR